MSTDAEADVAAKRNIRKVDRYTPYPLQPKLGLAPGSGNVQSSSDSESETTPASFAFSTPLSQSRNTHKITMNNYSMYACIIRYILCLFI